ncbi:hypothetical protein Tco_1061067, partial [Tanacetum coccineum]
KIQEDWEAEEEVKKLAEEEAIKTSLSNDSLWKKEQSSFMIQLQLKEGFLQNNDQMMTYLKHVGNKKHSDLKSKTFEEIQALYEKVKRFDESFTAVGSTEDERRIKEMNKGVKDTDQKRLKEEDTAKVPAKVEVTEQGTIDSETMEKKSFISKLDKVSSPEVDYLVIHRANGNFRAFNYLMEVLHIFDRQDLFHLYNLMMEQYSEITLEGIKLILWGDLKIMMESSIEGNNQSDFWDDQQDWEIVTWRLYEACGVYILELEDATVIHMDQTVLGKDYSNLLIADSLLKTIWFINAPCYGNEALASPKANELTIPEQTATGKGKSNPFMAGSLPKTTKPT